jgi:hypothetical protein
MGYTKRWRYCEQSSFHARSEVSTVIRIQIVTLCSVVGRISHHYTVSQPRRQWFKSSFCERKWRSIFKEKFLLFQDNTFIVSRNTFSRCEAWTLQNYAAWEKQMPTSWQNLCNYARSCYWVYRTDCKMTYYSDLLKYLNVFINKVFFWLLDPVQ